MAQAIGPMGGAGQADGAGGPVQVGGAGQAGGPAQVIGLTDNPTPGNPDDPNDPANWDTGVDSSRSRTVRAMTKLNMEPDFTLTVEQKTKIKAARADFDKRLAEWKAKHAVELTNAEANVRQALAGGDPQKVVTASKAALDVKKTSPVTTELDEKLLAILTDDQKNAVQAALAADPLTGPTHEMHKVFQMGH
jgi:hypothetical protein